MDRAELEEMRVVDLTQLATKHGLDVPTKDKRKKSNLIDFLEANLPAGKRKRSAGGKATSDSEDGKSKRRSTASAAATPTRGRKRGGPETPSSTSKKSKRERSFSPVNVFQNPKRKSTPAATPKRNSTPTSGRKVSAGSTPGPSRANRRQSAPGSQNYIDPSLIPKTKLSTPYVDKPKQPADSDSDSEIDFPEKKKLDLGTPRRRSSARALQAGPISSKETPPASAGRRKSGRRSGSFKWSGQSVEFDSTGTSPTKDEASDSEGEPASSSPVQALQVSKGQCPMRLLTSCVDSLYGFAKRLFEPRVLTIFAVFVAIFYFAPEPLDPTKASAIRIAEVQEAVIMHQRALWGQSECDGEAKQKLAPEELEELEKFAQRLLREDYKEDANKGAKRAFEELERNPGKPIKPMYCILSHELHAHFMEVVGAVLFFIFVVVAKHKYSARAGEKELVVSVKYLVDKTLIEQAASGGDAFLPLKHLRDHFRPNLGKDYMRLWLEVERELQKDSRIKVYPMKVRGDSLVVAEWVASVAVSPSK